MLAGLDVYRDRDDVWLGRICEVCGKRVSRMTGYALTGPETEGSETHEARCKDHLKPGDTPGVWTRDWDNL